MLVGLIAAVVVPGLAVPGILPAVADAVVSWSLERAIVAEGRDDVAAAIGDLGRAVHWCSADSERKSRLLCWRAMLKIANRDPRGAVLDADQAIVLTPTLAQARKVRALANVMLREPDAALDDAESAVALASRGDPEALNHRAYIRALVGRDLEAALADIEAALPAMGEGSAEFLDTKGFVLHLLGRHHEAVDHLNRAIEVTGNARRQIEVLAPHSDPDELAYRMRSLDHGLAVMHQHRALACQSLGLTRQAAQDFETAERKGYAPDRGIF